MSNPLISVIIPLYNQIQYLEECIQSIKAQNHNVEIILINDGSTDCQEYAWPDELKVIHQEHQGIAIARNRGLDFAQGEFIAFLDSDDIWVEGKLDLQLAHFERNVKLDYVFGYVEEFLSPELDKNSPQPPVKSQPMPGLLPGAMLAKKTSILQHGRFDPTLRIGEFIDFFDRAKGLGAQYETPDSTVLKRRIHATNTSHSQQIRKEDSLKLIQKALKRKRASN